ncbi:hypothetical protein O5624_02345 [Escherichia coli]|nr:hypothetical protein [Escherichia coli]
MVPETRGRSSETPDDTVAASPLSTAVLSSAGGAIRDQPPDGPKITVEKLKPEFRKGTRQAEVLASASLIKLNREQAVENHTAFSGMGYVHSPDRVRRQVIAEEVKSGFQRSVKDMDFISRRVAIDQGISWPSNVKYLLCSGVERCSALAFRLAAPGLQIPTGPQRSATKIYLFAIRGRWSRG